MNPQLRFDEFPAIEDLRTVPERDLIARTIVRSNLLASPILDAVATRCGELMLLTDSGELWGAVAPCKVAEFGEQA